MDAKKKKELSVNKSFDICFHSQFFPTPDLTEECTRGSMRRSRYFLEKKKKTRSIGCTPWLPFSLYFFLICGVDVAFFTTGGMCRLDHEELQI